jgi:hypothetical protein
MLQGLLIAKSDLTGTHDQLQTRVDVFTGFLLYSLKKIKKHVRILSHNEEKKRNDSILALSIYIFSILHYHESYTQSFLHTSMVKCGEG